MLRPLVVLVAAVLPWPLKRRLLNLIPGYELHEQTRIGALTIVLVGSLRMEKGAVIQGMTICRGLERLELGEKAIIGKMNLIVGPRSLAAVNRRNEAVGGPRPALIMGRESAITTLHYIDCSDAVVFEEFSTLGGAFSQVLTHFADVNTAIVERAPVRIGRYSLLNSNCVITAGAVVPPYSLVGAKAMYGLKSADPYKLYGGIPAKPVKDLSPDAAYFSRAEGAMRWSGASERPHPQPD